MGVQQAKALPTPPFKSGIFTFSNKVHCACSHGLSLPVHWPCPRIPPHSSIEILVFPSKYAGFRLISLELFSNAMIYHRFCHGRHRHTRKPAMYLCCRSGESGEIGCNPRLAWLTASPLRFLSGDSPHSMWGAWCVAGLLACPASISAPHSRGESPHSFFMSGEHESLML